MNKESVYLHLPQYLQNFVIGIEGRRIDQRRYGGDYADIASDVFARDSFSEENLQAYRELCLRQQLFNASQTDYWKNRFAEFGVDIQGVAPFVELSKLPVLTKDEVRSAVNDIRNPTLNGRDLLSRHTSGTTGSGLIFPETRFMERVTWATWWRYRSWYGIQRGDWCGYFGGRSIVPLSQQAPPFWRVNRPGRLIMFSGYHLSSSTAADYIGGLIDSGVNWLHGYPSMLSLLANYVLEQKLTVPKIRIVTIGAENLLNSQKSIIEEAFNAPVRQHYGQAEGVANISECPEGRLHVDEDFSGVEFVPIDELPRTYRIVGTNWHNSAFPLLRYDTGDVAILDEEVTCRCGRSGRIVKSIDGRQEDYVILPNGVRVGRLDHVFKDIVNIREAQIVQKKAGELEVRLVTSEKYSERDEQSLLQEFEVRLGKDIKLALRYVDSLPRTKSGKLRLVVRE